MGIDLGTATTVVYVGDKGIVMREPTLVAVNRRTDQVVAMGKAGAANDRENAGTHRGDTANTAGRHQ